MTDESNDNIEKMMQELGYGSQQAETKQNVHTFLHNVATAEDTTKLGNLKEDEIGLPSNPLRVYKNMALFANDIMENEELAKYFLDESEIITSTSLSKEALLLRLAVTQKRELADVTKTRKENKGWFKKKDDKEEEM